MRRKRFNDCATAAAYLNTLHHECEKTRRQMIKLLQINQMKLFTMNINYFFMYIENKDLISLETYIHVRLCNVSIILFLAHLSCKIRRALMIACPPSAPISLY